MTARSLVRWGGLCLFLMAGTEPCLVLGAANGEQDDAWLSRLGNRSAMEAKRVIVPAYENQTSSASAVATADRVIARTSSLIATADLLIAQATAPGDQPEGSPTPTPKADEPAAPPSPTTSPTEKPKTETQKEEKPPEAQGGTKEQPPTPGSPSDKDKEKDKEKEKGKTASSPATGEASAPKDKPPSGAAAKDQPQEEEREVARVPLAAVQAGGLLLPKDSMIIEPTLLYTYSQSTRLIITGFSVLPLIILGTLDSERVTNNLVSTALQLRYGLYRGLQFDFRLPYSYANATRTRVSTDQAGQVTESQHDNGIGDITFGLTYQFLYERGWYPDLMLRVGATAPTGQSQFDIYRKIASAGGLTSTEDFLRLMNSSGIPLGGGRWTISTAVNGVKALDPGILFATLGWSYTPPSNQDLISITSTPVSGGVILNPQLISARLGAINALQTSVGLAISLNNQLSVNFSISDYISKATTVNGSKVPGSETNIGQFSFGLNLALNPSTTVTFTGQFGITPDAPNLIFLGSVPMFYSNVMENAYSSLRSKLTDLFRGKPAPIEKPKQTEDTKPK